MQYQSFPEVKGNSSSLEKLKCLRLPALAGKRFLDVGCNEGFFCGYARYDGAARVVGIDRSREAIAKASLRFPDVEFLCQFWDQLPEGPFDVITLLSALHYAEDQEALIHRLMELLADDGVLVLEIGIAPGGDNRWVTVKRSIDERLFPTHPKLASILSGYAWKVIGHSVKQPGDPLQRYVVHVRKLKPYAFLLLENSGAGKSTIARNLFAKNDVPLVSGDWLFNRIANGKIEAVPERLQALVSKHYTSTTIDKMTRAIFKEGLAAELVDVWVARHGYQDFALDSYVPEPERETVRALLEERGFFPVNLTWQVRNPLPTGLEVEQKTKAYVDYLQRNASALEGQRVVQVRRCVPEAWRDRLSWHLDAPVSGEMLLKGAAAHIAGWAITKDEGGASYEVVFRAGTETFQAVPRKQRPDVLKAVFGDLAHVPPFWQEYPCGFALTVPVAALERGGELALMIDGVYVPVAKLDIDPLGSREKRSLPRRLLRGLRRLRRSG